MTEQPQPGSDATSQAAPAPKPAKPRLLQDGRDMFWSMAPLVAACILLAGMVGMCSFQPGGAGQGQVPFYDADAALRADAEALGFPVRLPVLSEGWQSNSGSRGGIENGRADPSTGQRVRAKTSTVGFIGPTGMYLGLTQSDADEEKLVHSIHPGTHPAGVEDVEGTKWIVYEGGEGTEPVWTTRLTSPVGPAQIAVTGAGSSEEFRALAIATQSQQPLPAHR